MAAELLLGRTFVCTGLRIGISFLGATIGLLGVAGAGFEVLTTRENGTIPSGTVVLRLTGKIDPPLASDLAGLWTNLRLHYDRVLLDLDSPGGSLSETEALVETIAVIRKDARVDTLVRHGAMCASACVAVFVQGEDRAAGGASVWIFHGAYYEGTNVPSLALTDRYLDILRSAGVTEVFLSCLLSEGYVGSAGKFWLSGYELFHAYNANVITRLLEPWRPEPPYLPPIDPLIGPR